MTGRELIIYILENNLEDEVILKDGVILGMMVEEEAAVKYGVGPATIKAWYEQGILSGLKVGKTIFIPKSNQ